MIPFHIQETPPKHSDKTIVLNYPLGDERKLLKISNTSVSDRDGIPIVSFKTERGLTDYALYNTEYHTRGQIAMILTHDKLMDLIL